MSIIFLKPEKKNGIQKGRYERKKRTEEKNGEIKGAKEKSIEIAKEMLKERMSIDKIMKFTGLTKEEIEKIK